MSISRSTSAPRTWTPARTPSFSLIRRFTAPSTWSAVTMGARTATSTQGLFVQSLTEFQIGELPSFTLSASAGAGGSITPDGH